MKQQFILLLAIAGLLFSSCDEDQDPVLVSSPRPVSVPRISSFYPESGAWGTTVAIFGDNFGSSISDNYVTFSGTYAEVTGVQQGAIIVRVPLNLASGDHQINVSIQGQVTTSPQAFRLTEASETY